MAGCTRSCRAHEHDTHGGAARRGGAGAWRARPGGLLLATGGGGEAGLFSAKWRVRVCPCLGARPCRDTCVLWRWVWLLVGRLRVREVRLCVVVEIVRVELPVCALRLRLAATP